MELFNIFGVEIFSTGTHKGDVYLEQDLDEMVNAYAQTGFIPPLKLGHSSDKIGEPALGWCHNLRRIGSKLVADFMELPKIVFDAVKSRSYDRVSAEIYFQFKKQDGTILPKALKAVALLGAEIPAIRELKPLREVVHEDSSQEWKVYETNLEGTLITIEREGRKMELEEKIKELEDKLAKVIGFKEGEVKELNAKVTELTAALELAKGESKKFSETDSGKKVLQLQKQLEDTNAQLETSMRKYAETEKKKADLEESQRKERIERKVKDLKFPALRPYIEVFYEVSTKGETSTSVMKFSADGSASKELTVERIVDGLISTLNRLAENKLFSEMSTIPEFRRDDLPPSDDPREETDKRVREYCAKHNMDYVKDYSIAMKAVFVEDPKLKILYSES